MTDRSLVHSSPFQNFIFLIDTSKSMYFSLRAIKKLVKDTLNDLLKKPNAYFNVIAFNTKLYSWADRCVPCTPQNVAAASGWLSSLNEVNRFESSHLHAIFTAFDDDRCDAIFLASNSRPVQKVGNVIVNSIGAALGRPIHCLYPTTFRMLNTSAKIFMMNLAVESGGDFVAVDIDDYGNFVGSKLEYKGDPMERIPRRVGNNKKSDSKGDHWRSRSQRQYRRDNYDSFDNSSIHDHEGNSSDYIEKGNVQTTSQHFQRLNMAKVGRDTIRYYDSVRSSIFKPSQNIPEQPRAISRPSL